MEVDRKKVEERVADLKAKCTDKTIPRSKRREFMSELVKESYKLDNRKSISLYRHRFLQFWGSFLLCLSTLYDLIKPVTGLEGTKVGLIITLALSLGAAVFLIIWIVTCVVRKIELEDEMATENLNKARAAISGIVAVCLLVVMMGMGCVSAWDTMNISVTLDAYNLSQLAIIVFYGYAALESGLFLWYERQTAFDEGEE